MMKLFDKTAHKVLMLLVMACLCSISVVAQKKQTFDPVKFEEDLEKFIASEVKLTPTESSAFFPVYREMRKKQMAYFMEERSWRKLNVNNEKACTEAIRRRDKNEVEMKVLQKNYHERFMTILPATKVLKVLKAERQFHKQCYKKARSKHERK